MDTATAGSINVRREYSAARLLDLHRRINKLDSLEILSNLCIFVTGSYGRHKAFKYSGLDLFFIHSDSKQTHRVSRIQKILFDAKLIELARELGFPEFS
jgi:UTP:GlnB (protein PII) uridylyltransferase